MKIKDKYVKKELKEIKDIVKQSYLERKMDNKDLYAIKAIGKLETLLQLINWGEGNEE